jgi:hypothetical protein
LHRTIPAGPSAQGTQRPPAISRPRARSPATGRTRRVARRRGVIDGCPDCGANSSFARNPLLLQAARSAWPRRNASVLFPSAALP